MKLRYTRFERISNSREEAIKKLDNLSRYFAENVAIRYYVDGGKYHTILALFRSSRKGDYTINYDSGLNGSGASSEGNENLKIVSVDRLEGETDGECLSRLYFDSTPEEGSVVLIIGSNSYIFHNGLWCGLTNNFVFRGGDSETLSVNIEKDEVNGSYTITGNVLVDNESIVVGEDGGICVGVIDGGTL